MNKGFKISLILVIAVGALKGFSLLFQDVLGSKPEPVAKESIAAIPSDGEFKIYYPNGQLKSIQHYKSGAEDSIWYYFFPNGFVESKVLFKNGMKNGVSYYYDDSGKMVYSELFKSGESIDKHIVNDSLYKYNVTIIDDGSAFFQNSCYQCHDLNAKFLKSNLSRFAAADDTTSDQWHTIEQLHGRHPDSLWLNNTDTLCLDSAEKFVERYEIDAIYKFLEEERGRAFRKKIKRLRKPKRRTRIVDADFWLKEDEDLV